MPDDLVVMEDVEYRDRRPSNLRLWFNEKSICKLPSTSPETITIIKKLYDPFDPGMVFQAWLDVFVAIAIKRGTLTGIWPLSTIVGLLRPEDLEYLEKALAIADYPDEDEFYFQAGFYDRVVFKEERADEVLSLPRAGAETLEIRRSHRHSLCRQFADTGIIGSSAEFITTAGMVEQVCKGIQQWDHTLPNVLLVGEPGTGKEGLARTIH